jgi:hypothetical protein
MILTSSPSPAKIPQTQPVPPHLKGNVYHIVLDEMQGDAALLYLQEGKVKKAFRGFTLFKNNTSNYVWTFQSFHSYMTGTTFQGGSYAEWMERYRTGGLLKALADKGFKIVTYTPAFYDFRTDLVSEAITLEEILAKKSQSKHLLVQDFVQVWFGRVMPNFFTNKALALGRKLGVRTRFLLPERADSPSFPTSFPEGVQPYASVLMLKELIQAERFRDPKGQYLYIHPLLPRGPYVMDERGEYVPKKDEPEIQGYYTQVRCALNLVVEFLEELKRLGRYEGATIIIQSDHGSTHGFIKTQGEKAVGGADFGSQKPGDIFLDNQLGWTEEVVKGRILSLLMIKPPGSSGKLIISEQPSQLADIYPTLIQLLGLDPKNEKLDGFSLFGKGFPLNREFSFFLTPHGEDKPADVVKVYIDNPQNLWASKLIDQGSVYKRPSVLLPVEGRSFEFGGNEDNLWLVGFADKEKEGKIDPLRFRWALGRHSRIVFRGVQLPAPRRLSVQFEVEPYMENRNEEMVLKSKLSSARVVLKPGWSEYYVDLEFPGSEDLAMDVEYKKAVSPLSLGVDPNDARELAVRWKKVTLSHLFLEQGRIASFGFGVPDEGKLRLEGFADKEKEGEVNPLYFRWGVGKRNRIVFRGLRLKSAQRLSVEFEVEPFIANRNKEMVLKSKLSSSTVKLKPGWSKYSVDLDFPGNEDLVLEAEFEKAVSPRTLGLDANDPRDLSARWKSLRFFFPGTLLSGSK